MKTLTLPRGTDMTWFAFKGLNGGKAVDVAGIYEKSAVADGFHGYATESEAESHPNAINPLTKLLAESVINGATSLKQVGAQPGGPNASNPVGAVAQQAGNDLGLGNVDKLFGNLTQKSTWIRAGEIILGALLMAVGIAKLSESNGLAKAITNNVPPVRAAKGLLK